MTSLLPVAVAPVAALPHASDPVWRRMLGAAELAYCAGLRRTGEHLAARALARRVVARSLAWPPGEEGERWQDPTNWPDSANWPDMVIARVPSGRPTVVLRGAAAQWRERCGLPVPGVSLSHAAGYAAALAWLPERDRDDGGAR